MLRWEELQRDKALSYFITDLLPVADNKSVTGRQKTAGCAKIGCFCSFQSSRAAIKLSFYSPVLRGQEEKFLLPLRWLLRNACIQKMLSLWANGEPSLGIRDIIRQMLSWWRRWEGREGALIVLRERWRHKGRRERMCDWIWPSGRASCLLAPWMRSLCYNGKEWALAEALMGPSERIQGFWTNPQSQWRTGLQRASKGPGHLTKFNYTHCVAICLAQEHSSK